MGLNIFFLSLPLSVSLWALAFYLYFDVIFFPWAKALVGTLAAGEGQITAKTSGCKTKGERDTGGRGVGEKRRAEKREKKNSAGYF